MTWEIAGYLVGAFVAIIGALLLMPWVFLVGFGIDCYFFLAKSKKIS